MDLVVLFGALVGSLAFLYYLFRAIGYGSAQASREKRYVFATGFGYVLLIIAICWLGIAYIFSGLDMNSEIPLSMLPMVFLLPASLIVCGLAQVYYADAAAALYERRRGMGGISRWLIPSVPKRESFILRGWLVAGTGAFILAILVFGTYLDSTNGYLH